jgi:hypothetical protein
VHADIEGKTIATEGMGKTPGGMMLLEYHDAMVILGQRSGAGKSADAGTDDNGIPNFFS